VGSKSLAELQEEIREVKAELAARDGELPLGLSVFYRGSLILGNVGLFGAGTVALLLAITLAAMSVALVPIGALKMIAGVIVFGATWTWSSFALLRGTARLTLAGLQRVLDEGTGRGAVGALSAGGSSTMVPATIASATRAKTDNKASAAATLAGEQV
jgi:hypothetical protein